MRDIGKDQRVAAMADPKTYQGPTIIIWMVNEWRDLKPDQITDDALQLMKKFVADGGDLVFFEQFAMTNMKRIDSTFGIRTGGGPRGADVADPALADLYKQAGVTSETLDALQFYNTYPNPPEGSVILLKTKKEGPGVAVIPYGKGRLVMMGLVADPFEQKLLTPIFKRIYGYSPATPAK